MSDPKGSGIPKDDEGFETNLVRVTDLDASGRAAFPNIGADMLAAGQIEVEKEEEQQNEEGRTDGSHAQHDLCR